MMKVNTTLKIDEREIQFDFIRATGPGGQNVNKVSTAVQLRFNLSQNTSLPEDVKRRLVKLAGKRMTEQGELIIQANRYRTQERNRQDALERLISLIEKASQPPQQRHATQPSAAAREKRLQVKRHRAWIKAMRRQEISEE